eukprot:550520_1
MTMTMSMSVFVALMIGLPIAAYSSNLLCEPDLWMPSESYHLNHTTCTISTVHTTSVEGYRAMLTDINYRFSNPSHYPLNFTIHAIPFGNVTNFGIIFSTGGGYWGYSSTTDLPTTLTYEWLSVNSTSYRSYTNGVFDNSFMANNPASSINEIGIQVAPILSASTGVLFDFASFKMQTEPPTQHPSVFTLNPTVPTSTCAAFASDPYDDDAFLLCQLFEFTTIPQIISDANWTESYCTDPWYVRYDFEIEWDCTPIQNDTNYITTIRFASYYLNETGLFYGHLTTSHPWPEYLEEIDLESAFGYKSSDWYPRFYGVWNWSTLTQLEYLIELDLQNNNFTGTITNNDWNNIASMPELRQLVLADNYFECNFSEIRIENVSLIEILELQDNLWYGSIDTSTTGFFSKFPNLEVFRMGYSYYLGGHFTNFDGLALCTKLRTFRIGSNQFTGSLTLSDPNGTLPLRITTFDVASNDFHGSVDWRVFAKMNNLVHLQMSSNKFNGSVDWKMLANLTNLRTLYLSYNNFNGSIDWAVIGALSYAQLVSVHLEFNSFSGFANFKDINEAISIPIRLDPDIMCDPSRYVCAYKAHPVLRSSSQIQCVGKSQCEAACKCSDGLTAFIASEWNVSAVWSSSFLFLIVYVVSEGEHDFELKPINDTLCHISDVFDEYTIHFMDNATMCRYNFRDKQINTILVEFQAPWTAQQVQQMPTLQIKGNALLYARNDTMGHWIKLQVPATVHVGYPHAQTPMIVAIWSTSFLFITIEIQMVYDGDYALKYNDLDTDCGIFDDNTLQIIGNDDAVCSTYHQDDVYQHLIIIDLPSTATIQLNDVIVVREDVFSYKHEIFNDEQWIAWKSNITLDILKPPTADIDTPNIIASIPNQIGICTDLVLDARSTTNLGGRNAVFVWELYDEYDQFVHTYLGEYVVIQSSELLLRIPDSPHLRITLNVTNWYNTWSLQSFAVSMSHDKVIPMVHLYGIREYQSSNTQLNSQLTIYSSIAFDMKCDASSDYDITWCAAVEALDDDIDIDDVLFQSLVAWLASKREDMISVDASLYFQNGVQYTFTMNIKHKYGDYDVNSTHSIQSSFSDLICNIAGSDVAFHTPINIDFFSPQPYRLSLDAKTLSYDPDHSASDNHLSFWWHCYTSNGSDCGYIMQSDTQSITSALFDDDLPLIHSTFYSFRFVVNISDENHQFRKQCTDEIWFEFHTLDANITDDTAPFPLIISVLAIKDTINVDDKLRLMANVINHDTDNEDTRIDHEWTETNGLFTHHQLTECNQLNDAVLSLNLILEPDCVPFVSGQIYSFQLNVSIYDGHDKLIALGISSAVSIFIHSAPKVTANSLQLEPYACGDGPAVYSSIVELLMSPCSLSIHADSAYGPLLYAFYAEDEMTRYYLHPWLRSQSYIDDIYIPVGDWTLFVNVYDSQSSMATASISCSVSLESTTRCIDDFGAFIANRTRFMTSEHDKYSLVLQQTLVYLHYLQQMQSTECVLNGLQSILEIWGVTIGDLCSSDEFEILLTQALTLWMQIVSQIDGFVAYFYHTAAQMQWIHHVIDLSLDPCAVIRETITYSNVEQLTISTDSIVTNRIKIYHESTDITSYLSHIVVNPYYHHLLYSVSAQLLVILRSTSVHSHDIYNLLSSALYISSLSSLCTSIPGETTLIELDSFSIYNTRISGNNHFEAINISLRDIHIVIPSDIANDNHHKKQDIFDSMDLLIAVMNSSQSRNVTLSMSQQSECETEEEGVLSEEFVSITLLGNGTNTTHLSSNINFTFVCEECDSYQCVWYNEATNKWQNEGCSTILEDNAIICSCSHLTTFATIHNIHSFTHGCGDIPPLLLSQWWHIINWIFAVAFFIFSAHVLFFLYPYFLQQCQTNSEFVAVKLKMKQPAIYAVSCLLAVSLLYLLICLQSIRLKLDFEHQNINILIFVSIFPILIYFILYSILFRSWLAVLFVGFDGAKRYKQYQHRVDVALFMINITMCLVAILLFTVFSFTTVFVYIEIAWCVIITVVSIVMIIAAVTLTKTLELLRDSGQKKTKKIKMIILCTQMYFVYVTCVSIYYTVYWYAFDVAFRGVDLFINLMFVNLIFALYKPHLATEINNRYARANWIRILCCDSSAWKKENKGNGTATSQRTPNQRRSNSKEKTLTTDKEDNNVEMSSKTQFETITEVP